MSPRSETGCFSQVHPEPVATALVAPGHLGRCVSELLLDVTLVDFGRTGEAGTQAMAREEREAVFLGQLGPDAGIKNSALDQSRNVLVVVLSRKWWKFEGGVISG
jgi:hypothetical protein